jgi:hypothetical protein
MIPLAMEERREAMAAITTKGFEKISNTFIPSWVG